MRNRGGTGVPATDEVDINHRPPLLGCRRVPGADGENSGVGDRSVKAAKFGYTVVNRGG